MKEIKDLGKICYMKAETSSALWSICNDLETIAVDSPGGDLTPIAAYAMGLKSILVKLEDSDDGE